MADTIRAFVCGHPVAHSRSPAIHGHWLARYGIFGSYRSIDVSPDGFADFVHRIGENGYVGGNVTIPHKEAACRLVTRRDQAAEEIGAVNTLWFDNGVLCGGNTDAEGFAANLDERAPGWAKNRRTAVVLGAGGAARAVVFALRERGYRDIRVVNRTVARASELAAQFGPDVSAHTVDSAVELLADADLLVNTTALGMHGNAEIAVDPETLPDNAIVTDIVYVPLETPLLAAARRRGLRTVDGLGMLLHQAVPGFERWFGRKPEVDAELRRVIVGDLETAP